MKILATLPTFNESENILPLIDELLGVSRNLEVLVIDDNSPDGTWKLVGERAETDPRVHLLHRVNERGRGSAGVAGFCKALELGADLIVEMDADWSHHPRFLRQMLRATRRADVVIGSRLVSGGGETGRNPVRTLITQGANLYIRLLLGLPVRDCTSGYRVYRRWVLEAIQWEKVQSNGPAIVQEILVAAHAAGARIAEVPILFEERRAGQSTLNSKILLAGLAAQWRLLATQPPVRAL
ncbi:MAG: dolichol-phosphate mannosyltransferase [Candidatus Sumerlaeota bacterium]|nr:dolichol-phosphate mannosyltransferase [Candidatus Sumerlaeota bacterium]